MKTAVIYARYSSSNQTEQSIEGQLRVCNEYAAREGIVVLDTYIDRAMTGTNDNRADFQRMIKDSGKREWEHVIVYKLDRFSRDKYATAVHKKTLKDNGVKLLSATECIPDTPEGIIMESLIEGMGQYYSEELSQKVRRGMNETMQKGNFTGGHLLYGYSVENKKVIIDEEKAEIVRYIFEQYSVGVYVEDIIADLTAKGVYNRGKPFARNTVYKMLKNEKYSGIYRLGDEVFENMYPQIVTPTIFEIVREKVKVNQYGKRSLDVVYLLRNKMKCGYCGQSMNAECGTSKNGQRKHYYKCFGRKRNSGCKKKMIQKDLLEKLVIEAIITVLSNHENKETLISAVLKQQERRIAQNSILKILLREQKQVNNALENMVAAIEQGVITNTTTKRLKELETRLEDLERQILIERSKNAVKVPESAIREYYDEALTLGAEQLINYLIKDIVLYDDKIEIHFNKPTRTSPDESQGFSIYTEKNGDITIEIKV